ncbi:MAG: formylglycine-generating enzyme family protein [Gallionella sp.]|nr:formylglycine-generating enzyme family protein [Gallionella sp.]MDD4958548.1 formylglycine-generating enzyme family protein [Gallionella sp.]
MNDLNEMNIFDRTPLCASPDAQRLAEAEARHQAALNRVQGQRLWFLVGVIITAAWAWQARGEVKIEADTAWMVEMDVKAQNIQRVAFQTQPAKAPVKRKKGATKQSTARGNEAQSKIFETTIPNLHSRMEPTSWFIRDVFAHKQQESLFMWLKREIKRNPHIASSSKNGWYARLSKMSVDQLTELVFLITRDANYKARVLSERFAFLAQEVSLPLPLVSPTRPDMVDVPAGVVVDDDCTPLLPAFQIGKYEVTSQQWRAVMGGERRAGECDLCAATVGDAAKVEEFIRRLNAKTGKHYRLPTQVEWTYACFAGKATAYCGGDDVFAVAWSSENSDLEFTHPVGMKLPNAWGLYDMNGNADELVQDKNPQVSEEGNNDISCGGSLDSGEPSPNCGETTYHFADRSNPVGFRLARTIPSSPSNKVIKQEKCEDHR